jgi:outer membrane protein, multidrug efflux system
LRFSTSILRTRRARLVPAAGLGLLLLAIPARAKSPYTPYHGDTAPDSVVSGTMPEDYLPGLMDIVHTALKHGPSMIVQQIQVAQAEAAMLNADSVLYPQLNAGGSYGLASESVGEAGQFGAAGSHSTGNSTSESYSVSAGMPVFRWGAVWNGIRVQKLALEITKKSYAEAYRGFVLQLRDSYMALVAKKIGVRNAQQNLKISNDNFAQAQENLKNGVISEGSTVAPRLAAEDASLSYDRLVQDYSHSKRVLAQLAGVPDIADDSIPDDLPKVAYAPAVADAVLAAFLRDGARSTFQAENMEMAIHQDQLNYLISLTRQLPGFSAYYGYSAADTTSIALASTTPGQPASPASIAKVGETSISYGISAGWDIFDGFATTAGIRSAKATKRIAERQFQTYLDTTLEQAQDYRRQLDLSARAMGLAEERYALAGAALRQTTADFKFGTATQAMVDGSNYSVYLAMQSQLSARADFLSHWSSFVSLTNADPALGLLPIQYVRAIH